MSLIKKIFIIDAIFIPTFVFGNTLPSQIVNNGSSLVIKQNETYLNSGVGWDGAVLFANGQNSNISIENDGKITVIGEDLIGTAAVRTYNNGYINIGNNSKIEAYRKYNSGQENLTTGALYAEGGFIEGNNVDTKVIGNAVIQVITTYINGNINLKGLTNIDSQGGRSNVGVVSKDIGSLINLADINIKITNAITSTGVVSRDSGVTNIHGSIVMDLSGDTTKGALAQSNGEINLYDNATIISKSDDGSAYGMYSLSGGKIKSVGDINIDSRTSNNHNGYGIGAFNNGFIDFLGGHYSIDVFSDSQLFVISTTNSSSIKMIGTFDVNAISNAYNAYGIYSSGNSQDSIIHDDVNSYSNWNIKGINAQAIGIYTMTSNSLILGGNHIFKIMSDSDSSYGIYQNGYGNLKQTGNLILNVDGNNATGIKLSNTSNNIELENLTASVTTIDNKGNAYGISVDTGSQLLPSKLIISGDSNNLTTNGVGIYADNGFLNTDLINTKITSTVGQGFDIKNGSVVNLKADNSHFIGNSIVDDASSFNLSLLNNSRWDIKTDSNTTNLTNQSGSIIDLTNDDNTQYNELVVEEDYFGGTQKPTLTNPKPNSNGLVVVNTVWNNTDSSSDTMKIKGTADGYTEVKTKSGIIGNVTNNGTEKYSTNVITVDNHRANTNAFYGFADTVGAGQAILKQRDDNHYAWYLDKNSFNPVTPITPMKPEIPGYIGMKKSNMELGYELIGTLHQRMGEAQTMNLNRTELADGNQLWGRLLGKYSKNRGENRFDYRSKMWGVQFGYDFDIQYDAETDSRTHTGLMFTYARDNLTFYDNKFVTFDKSQGDYVSDYQQTGKGHTNAFALGLNSTHYNKNNGYLDLVAQIDYMRNSYNSMRSDNVNNHSFGLTLSAEIGRPYALNQNWSLEPQAQLIYQYRKFSDFNMLNDIRVSSSENYTPGLKGRVGLRLAYSDLSDEANYALDTFYVTANLIHNFINDKNGLKVGSDWVDEGYSRTQGEIGVGLQFKLNAYTFLYSDIRYSHSLDNSKGNSKSYTGNIGIKWQL